MNKFFRISVVIVLYLFEVVNLQAQCSVIDTTCIAKLDTFCVNYDSSLTVYDWQTYNGAMINKLTDTLIIVDWSTSTVFNEVDSVCLILSDTCKICRFQYLQDCNPCLSPECDKDGDGVPVLQCSVIDTTCIAKLDTFCVNYDSSLTVYDWQTYNGAMINKLADTLIIVDWRTSTAFNEVDSVCLILSDTCKVCRFQYLQDCSPCLSSGPDKDGDGVPDLVDLDADNDGILDAIECCVDSDMDGIMDNLDLDSDNDGIPDAIEACGNIHLILENCMLDSDGSEIYLDYDGNGCVDGILNAICQTPIDTDMDGIPDYLDSDSDNDGCSDSCEAGVFDPDTDGIAGLSLDSVDTCGLVLGICSTPIDTTWRDANYQFIVDIIGDCNELSIQNISVDADFQWLRNGIPILGATDITYTPNPKLYGDYTVIATKTPTCRVVSSVVTTCCLPPNPTISGN